MKFHENPSNERRVVICGRMYGRTDGRTDGRTAMTMLIVAFSNYANAPKIPIRQVRRGYSIKISLCLI